MIEFCVDSAHFLPPNPGAFNLWRMSAPKTPPRIQTHSPPLSAARSEAKFLAGRHSRTSETLRLLRINLEFIRGFRALQHVGPAISVFGSARFPADHPYYKLARDIGALVASEGYAVITGGGPGLMEAANRGAKDVGGVSIGCNILLPQEQAANGFLDRVVTFSYFFVRKVMLVKYSYAFVILPGGYGTLDELTEAMTLIRTGKLYNFPIVLVGTEYWRGFHDWLQTQPLKQGAINADDLSLLHITDDLNEVRTILAANSKGLGLKLQPLSLQID